MIHQHFMLVPSQTVTENILLGLDKPTFPHESDRVTTKRSPNWASVSA